VNRIDRGGFVTRPRGTSSRERRRDRRQESRCRRPRGDALRVDARRAADRLRSARSRRLRQHGDRCGRQHARGHHRIIPSRRYRDCRVSTSNFRICGSPSCGSLVGVRDDKVTTAAAEPGLVGFAPLLRQLGADSASCRW
jgi:hypothetical protein